MDEKSHPTEGIPRPDWTATLKQNLTARFFGMASRTEHFCRLLKRHNALVAGGFLLKAIQPNVDVQNEGWKKGDIDLYVNVKNTRPLMEALFESTRGMLPLFQPHTYNGYLASLYCRSFMRRNGIRGVKSMDVKVAVQSPQWMTLDIVSIRNRRTPVQVVTNFDLTFCQLWFDGETVYATHPDHIEQRRGQLQGDYVETYLAGNRFLRKRIEKYRERGFEITFDHTPSDTAILNQLFEFPTQCHPERPYNEFVNHVIHRTLCLRYGQRKSDPRDIPRRDRVIAIPGGRRVDRHLDDTIESTMIDYTSQRYKPITRVNRLFFPHEGYDSTEEDDMKAMRSDPSNQWSEENFQRDLTDLFVNTFASLDFIEEDKSIHPDHLPRINLRDSPSMPFEKYTLWRSGMLSMLRKGKDLFGVTGPLLTFHQHDTEGGITPTSLRTYVTAHYESNGNADEPRPIPCFYQEKCDQLLTTAEQQCVMRHHEETEEEQERSENGKAERLEERQEEEEQEEQEEQEQEEQEEQEQEEEKQEENEEKNEQEEKQEAERLEAERLGQRGGRALRYTRRKKNPSSHKGSRPLTRKGDTSVVRSERSALPPHSVREVPLHPLSRKSK